MSKRSHAPAGNKENGFRASTGPKATAGGKEEDVGASVRDVRKQWGVTRKIFSRMSGFSERTLAGWEQEDDSRPPSESARRRIRELHYLLHRLRAKLRDVLGVPEVDINRWLETPNEALFEGFKPLELIERGEIDKIYELIFRIEHNVPII
jgi:hypothetical protein